MQIPSRHQANGGFSSNSHHCHTQLPNYKNHHTQNEAGWQIRENRGSNFKFGLATSFPPTSRPPHALADALQGGGAHRLANLRSR